jgi:lysophospholipase L1-like esterase
MRKSGSLPFGSRIWSAGTSYGSGSRTDAVAAFVSPLDYEPALWLKADALALANAAAVTSWTDSSGFGRHATQATADRQPTFRTGVLNSQPVVRFDGGDGLSTTSVDLSGTDKVTVFCVASMVAAGDRVLVEFSDNYNSITTGFLLFRANASNKPNWSIRGNASSGVAHTCVGTAAMAGGTGVFGIMVGQADKSFSMQDVGYSFANNWRYAYTPTGAATVSTADNTNSFSNRTFNIGARDADGTITLPMQGDIAEIIVYPTYLNSAQIQNVGNYLGAKYGAALWNPMTASIVFEGDSLTEGDKLPTSAPPHTLMGRFTDTGVWYAIPAVSGQTLAQMQADYATQIKPLRNLALGDKNVITLWGGTNDMSSPGGNVSAATALSRFYAYADTLRADGWYVIGVTMIPRDDAAAPADFEAKRAAFNADVVSNWASHFDALAQPHLRAEFDAEADAANATFYNADLVHLTAAGYALIADDLEPLFAAIGIT